MSIHSPIGSCCTRPRFNFVGGIDDRPGSYALLESGLVQSASIDRRKVILGASIVVALTAAYVYAQVLLAN